MTVIRLSIVLALVGCAAGAASAGERSLAWRLAEEQRRSATFAAASLGGWHLSAAGIDEKNLPLAQKVDVLNLRDGFLGDVETLSHKVLTRLRGGKASVASGGDGSKLGAGESEDITLGDLLFILLMLLLTLFVCGCLCLCCSTIMGAAVVYNVRLNLLLEEKDRLETRMPRHMKEKVAHPDFRRLCDDLFNEVDTSRAGELQAVQLKNAVMQAYGQELQNERFFIELFDSDRSGTVNKMEFFQIMKFYEFIAYEKAWGKQPEPGSGYEPADPMANEPYETRRVSDTKAVEAD